MIVENISTKLLLFYKILDKETWINVSGQSMYPIILEGDKALVRPNKFDTQYMKDEVVVFMSENSLLIHRIMKVIDKHGSFFYITKGDNAYCFDKIISSDQIIGTVTHIRRNNGCVFLLKLNVLIHIASFFSFIEGYLSIYNRFFLLRKLVRKLKTMVYIMGNSI